MVVARLVLKLHFVIVFLAVTSLSSTALGQSWPWNFGGGDTTQTTSGDNQAPNAATEACNDIPVGGNKKVQYTDGSGPTKLKAAYTLERTKDVGGKKGYIAHLNLSFTGKEFSSDAELTKSMLDRANACLAQPNIANRLRDAEGNKLQFKLHNTNEVSGWRGASVKGENGQKLDLARPIKIGVSLDARRSYMDTWAAGISCENTVHELMHHLGLCDEYDECKYNPANCPKCRSIGNPDSVMRDFNKAFADDWVTVTYKTCNCEDVVAAVFGNRVGPLRRDDGPGFERRRGQWRNRRGGGCKLPPPYLGQLEDSFNSQQIQEGVKNCPPGFSESSMGYSEFSGSGDQFKRFIRQITVGNPMYSIALGQVSRGQPPRGHALDNAHMRAIAYPGCEQKNSQYYNCVQTAYKDIKDQSQCKAFNLPAECGKEGEWAK